jgi:hypothetical protein
MSRKQFVFRYLYAFELGLAHLNCKSFSVTLTLEGCAIPYISINPNLTNRMLYKRGLVLSGYQYSSSS